MAIAIILVLLTSAVALIGTALLNGTYLNRLHNDWLETALTFSVPGIHLLLTSAGYLLRRVFVPWMCMQGARSAVAVTRMASIAIVILGIAGLSRSTNIYACHG